MRQKIGKSDFNQVLGHLTSAEVCKSEILRVTSSGQAQVLYDVAEPMVTALAILAGGDLLAGTSPGGKIYRILPDGNGSLWCETGERYVRMAHLACVGSHAVNGVSALHTDLLRRTVLADFHEHWPDLIMNVTNGVTPRRWLVVGNPGLTRLITGRIGERWITHMDELRRLGALEDEPGIRSEWAAVKLENKRALAARIRERTGIVVDPSSLFDVPVKRIHEYQRQHLNVLQCPSHSGSNGVTFTIMPQRA